LKSVRHVASGEALAHRIRMPVLDELLNRDGPGEVLVEVPERLFGEAATVFALEFDRDPRG
jgi:hypothetical protein